MMNAYPQGRRTGLFVKEVADETIIYDYETDQARCLNATASLVWKCCNGRRSLDQIRDSVQAKLEVTIDKEVIRLALTQLDSCGLLEPGLKLPTVSRRQVLRKLGTTAVLLPTILSVASPTQAQTASCLGFNEEDCRLIPCCPGLVCNTANGKCKNA